MAEVAVGPEQQSFSIVVLGDFNPSIFHPLWFSNNELMPSEETEKAEITAIQKGLSAFTMGDIQVQVDESRFGITTVESPLGPLLRDLALGTLTLLEHTPLRAIGFNLDMLFDMESEEAWHALGHRLVPKEDWNDLLENPGMQILSVTGRRQGCVADRLQFSGAPTNPVTWTVSVAVNQHYDLETKLRSEVRERHKEAIRVLRNDWNSFVNYARLAASQLLRLS